MKLPSIVTTISNNLLQLLVVVSLSIVVSCSGTEEKKTAETSHQASPKSAKIIDEIHAKFTDPYQLYGKISKMSLGQIAEIHTYFNIERWNKGSIMDRRSSSLYEAGAKALNLPVSELLAADEYYLYNIMNPLDTIVRQLYGKTAGIKLDFYNPLGASAWCGLHTISTEVVVYGGTDEKKVKEAAANQANSFIASLPEWVDGVKFTAIIRKDTVLETSDKIDAGFIWKRGASLKEMKASNGFGIDPAERSGFWDNPEWNEKKRIKHPEYKFIKPQTIE